MFTQAEFWLMWSYGLLGVAIWFITTYLSVDDPRVSGTPEATLKRHWLGLLMGLLCHTVGAVGLFDGVTGLPLIGDIPKSRSAIMYIICGFVAQTIVLKVLGMTLARAKAMSGGSADESEKP